MVPRLRCFSILISLAIFAPAVAVAQSCSVAQVAHDFSYEDTFNSSGTPLGDAYAVFQQDRFYVNQQGRLDPKDKPDPVMVTRQARATYGQAVRAFMNANGIGDMPAQVLVGSQYVVELEACGSEQDPSIQVLSMRMESDIEDDSRALDLELRNAELAERQQRLEQREEELDQWQRQLSEWERRLADWEARLSAHQSGLDGSDDAAGVDTKGATEIAPVPSDDLGLSETPFDRLQAMFANNEITDAASLGDCIMLSVGIARSDEQGVSYDDAAAYLQQADFRADVDAMTPLIVDAVDASDDINETSGMIIAILAEPWGALYASAAGVCVNGYHLASNR